LILDTRSGGLAGVGVDADGRLQVLISKGYKL